LFYATASEFNIAHTDLIGIMRRLARNPGRPI
jgi:hypothetical protein